MPQNTGATEPLPQEGVALQVPSSLRLQTAQSWDWGTFPATSVLELRVGSWPPLSLVPGARERSPQAGMVGDHGAPAADTRSPPSGLALSAHAQPLPAPCLLG